MIWHIEPHAFLVHTQYPAQRWFLFQNMGPSPSGRRAHAMASDGTRVFVLGGRLSVSEPADEATLIHVVDTSTYFRFCHLDGLQVSKQSTSSTRNLTPSLSSLVGRPPNSCTSHPRVPWPRSNHSARYPLHPMRTQYTILFKQLPPKNRAAPPPRSLLKNESPVPSVWPRYLQV